MGDDRPIPTRKGPDGSQQGEIVLTKELNDIMSFDHVIEVHSDGSITEPKNVWAPELYWSGDSYEFAGYEWKLLTGFSGQSSSAGRYPGPIMHPSEYIGGGLETYIREHPGLYVALVCDDIDNLEENVGWAVAFKESK